MYKSKMSELQESDKMAKKRGIVKVYGIVQGVGFRPFIHKLVNIYGFKGWVQNSSSGVAIDVEGGEESLLEFIREISHNAPALAVVEDVTIQYKSLIGYTDFKIIKSVNDEEGFVLVSPDVSICPDCYNELIDPTNKRYRYPFINCTNCGPRFSIIKSLPYDRDKTTMDSFIMCDECSNEYHDIDNRRYHAQPNCCPECGPKLSLLDRFGNDIKGDAIGIVLKKITSGNIVAVKGLGGFHLACNALDSKAVRKLRERKHRDEKPFAIMCRDVETIRNYAIVTDEEQKIIENVKRPIVLLKKSPDCLLPEEIAPDTDYLGFMLPYTPLHYLLFDNNIKALVMTSANISDNPVVYKNNEAINILNNIADYYLVHDREINIRCDDSVVRVYKGKEYFIRRSRGYAPFPVKLSFDLKPMLACGAEQKASFCVSKGRYAFLSQHIGDLKNHETLNHYENQVDTFKKLFRIDPEIIACDLHPDYLSTEYAEQKHDIKKTYIQHHHAHMASCMADNNLEGDVIGITWDGTGLGTDGTIWGGEVLTGGYSDYSRVCSFLPTNMPGGDNAVKNIYMMALSYLIGTFGKETDSYLNTFPILRDKGEEYKIIYKMISKDINSPITTSCGRLFDGIACLLGLCGTVSYEGQGAVKLESASKYNIADTLDYDVIKKDGLYVYDWRPTINNIMELIKLKNDAAFIASAFHNTLVEVCIRMVDTVRNNTGLNKVTISGGVFQNNYLLNKLVDKLNTMEFEVYTHNRVSTNDEGLSLGQIVIAQNGGGYDVPGSAAKDCIYKQ